MQIIVKPELHTNRLGGVDIPSAEALKTMHDSQYILHAAGGKLTRVPVEKTLLPHSDDMSPQGTHVDVGPDGAVYVEAVPSPVQIHRRRTHMDIAISNRYGGYTGRTLAGVAGRHVHRHRLLNRTGCA